MPTPGQQALADGFADNLINFGLVFVRTKDEAVIWGVPAELKPTAPQMVQGQDRQFAITVADVSLSPPIAEARCMPASPLLKADELTKGTKFYRVVRADYNEDSAMWYVVLSPSN